jgi:hypothetical protein
MPPRRERLAVLIDAENISADTADSIFTEIARIGETRVRRIYGDFSETRLQKWSDSIAKHGIARRQTFATPAGKNASDIALVIDAMDLLQQKLFDGFCIVSSDSDFAQLATRIQDQCIPVFGFGRHRTPEGFQGACDRFTCLDAPDAASACAILARNAAAQEPADAAVPLLLEILRKMTRDRDGWVRLAQVGAHIVARDYGYRKLSSLVRKTEAFEIENANDVACRIRPKQAATKK